MLATRCKSPPQVTDGLVNFSHLLSSMSYLALQIHLPKHIPPHSLIQFLILSTRVAYSVGSPISLVALIHIPCYSLPLSSPSFCFSNLVLMLVPSIFIDDNSRYSVSVTLSFLSFISHIYSIRKSWDILLKYVYNLFSHHSHCYSLV